MRYFLFLLTFISAFPAFSINTSIENNGARAFLGILDMDISRQKADLLNFPNAYGAYIKYVYDGTAAKAAGVQAFDYITAIDGDKMAFHTNLTDLLARHSPGDRVKLRIIRQGKTIELDATLGRSSDSNGTHYGGSAFLGITEHSESMNHKMGVKINTVRASSAIELGLDDGDVIMAINGYPMIDWTDISTVLNNMEEGDAITIDYTRQNQPQRASGKIGGERTKSYKSDSYSYSSGGRGYIGIYPGKMSREKARVLNFSNHYGSYIKKVIANSAADQAGLEPLDYIVAINDYRLNEDRSLTSALKKFSVGDQVTVHYIRDGRTRQVDLVLGAASDDSDCTPCSEDPFFGVSPYNDNSSFNENGVKVGIVKNSSAAAGGLASGDRIVRFDNKNLYDWSDLSAVINATSPGQVIAITYNRGNKENRTEITMGSQCDEHSSHSSSSYSHSSNNNSRQHHNSQPAVDMKRIKVDVQDMNEGDAGTLRSQGVNMPIVNNLNVEKLNLYPNPSKGMFRLEFELPNRAETSIYVYNSDGREIYSFDLGEYQGLFSDEIDISQNGAGAYYLQIQQGKASVSKKVMLQY